MNAEQKQRALQMLRRFERAVPMTRQADNAAVAMATLLQELVDAKEPEPVGEVVDFNGWRIVRWKGAESDFQVGTKFYTSPPANSQSEQHLEMVNQPALSDERIFKLFLEKAVDKGTAGIYDFAHAIERETLGRLGMTEAIDADIATEKGGA